LLGKVVKKCTIHIENMQNKYVLNDKYKIDISEVKKILNEIINNKNIE